jgi:type II secretory pathway pseudopilin PulG
MKSSRRSFTLLELILGIFVMGVLALVVVPRFAGTGFFETVTLRGVTSQVAADVRYARQLAITNAGHYLINFNFTSNTYVIYKNSLLPANQVGEIKDISSDVNCSGVSQFDFYALGNGVFNAAAGTGLFLSSGLHQYRVTIEPPTGVASVEKIL